MTDSVSMLDCPYWVRATSLSSEFGPTYEKYVTRGRDCCGGAFLRSLGTRADDIRVGVATPQLTRVANLAKISRAASLTTAAATAADTTTTTDAATPSSSIAANHKRNGSIPRSSSNISNDGSNTDAATPSMFPFMMVMPVCVPRSCADGDGTVVSAGMLSMLTDLLTSYHILLAQLPSPCAHVSVSLQCQMCTPMRVGDNYIAVSTLDKLGQRLIYCTVRILSAQPVLPCEGCDCNMANDMMTDAVSCAYTLDDVRELMETCTVFASVTHVKLNILPTLDTRRASMQQQQLQQMLLQQQDSDETAAA